MGRNLVSLVILVLGFTWIGIGAPLPAIGEPDLLNQQPIAFDPNDPEAFCDQPGTQSCADQINAWHAANRAVPPDPDPLIRDVLFQEPAIDAMTSGLVEGQDYWLDISEFTNPAHGDQGGAVTLILSQPISYQGEVTTATDPCRGLRGDRAALDTDPCLTEPRQYSKAQAVFTNVRVIHAQVDTQREEVVRMWSFDPGDEGLQDMIGYFSEKYEIEGPPATLSPR